jgi:hypothetical protein
MPKKKKKPRRPNRSSSGGGSGGGSIGKFRSGFQGLVRGKKRSSSSKKGDTFWTILTVLLAIFIVAILLYRYVL